MNLTTAQSAAARHDLALEHAPKVLASAEGMVAKGLYPPDVALDRAAEGWARVIASGRPYVSRADHTETETMDNTDYFAHPALNWSTAKHILHSPKRYKWRLGKPVEPTARMQHGTVFHALVLEPDTLSDIMVVWEGESRRTKAYKDFAAAHKGRIILSTDEWDRIRRTAESVETHPVAGPMVREAREAGEVEVTEFFTCPETGLECKRKLDLRGADLKLSFTVDARAFERHAKKMLYHGQMGWYFDDKPPAIIAATDADETDCAVFQLDDEIWKIGRAIAVKARRLVQAHTASDHWPGRDSGSVQYIGAEDWDRDILETT